MNHGIHKYNGQDFPEFIGNEIEVTDDNSNENAPAYSIRFVDESSWHDGMDDEDIEWQS